jgi:hypothetical protein
MLIKKWAKNGNFQKNLKTALFKEKQGLPARRLVNWGINYQLQIHIYQRPSALICGYADSLRIKSCRAFHDSFVLACSQMSNRVAQ